MNFISKSLILGTVTTALCSFANAAKEEFKLYKTQNAVPGPRCDRFTHLTLETKANNKANATLLEKAVGPGCPRIDPLPRKYNLTAKTTDCKSIAYSGKNEAAKVVIVDSKNSICQTTIPVSRIQVVETNLESEEVLKLYGEPLPANAEAKKFRCSNVSGVAEKVIKVDLSKKLASYFDDSILTVANLTETLDQGTIFVFEVEETRQEETGVQKIVFNAKKNTASAYVFVGLDAVKGFHSEPCKSNPTLKIELE